MNSTTSAPGRLARAVAMQLLKRLTGGTVRLVDPFGDARFGDDTAPQASPPIDVTVRVRDHACVLPHPARGQRRAR